ncbi:MAG: NADP-dependent oxidoreductase [Betaproteobacteria bacterium]|nr:NADP-dependent oxidoreductase [Betaproteobacteria bacterium]
MPANRQVLFASRPRGWVSEDNFRLVESPLPVAAEGQVLVRNHWLSLDPYMRGRMDAGKSYAKGAELGQVMVGGTAGEVLESKSPKFKTGDMVAGALGWQEYGAAEAAALTRIDTSLAPASYYLGILGMPGVTAWMGLLEIAQPKEGETVVVSAAAGAVGGAAGQIARIKGCRAVGIAGGKAKCDYVTGELGFDACVDYKAGRLQADLQAAAPNGIDVCFENVGGELFDTVLARMNPFSRIALCGLVSQYNLTRPYALKNLRSVLVNRIRMQGFIVADRFDSWPRAKAELAEWLKAGKLKCRESIAQGLENAPRAFIGMLKGENLGKQLVKLV